MGKLTAKQVIAYSKAAVFTVDDAGGVKWI